MGVLWVAATVLFWVGYYRFTRGALTRHLAFLHFAIYYFAIYLAAYPLYLETDAHSDRFILSVIAYPLLALAGMIAAKPLAPLASFTGTPTRTSDAEKRLVIVIVAFFLAMYAIYLHSLGEIPLVGVLTGGDLRASRLARYLATKGYTGEGVGGLRLFYWVPRLFLDYFASFVVVFTLYRSRARGRSFWTFLPFFAGLVFLTLLQVEKYPAAKLFVILALCLYNVRFPRMRARSVMVGAALAVAGVFFMGLVYGTVSGAYRARATGLPWAGKVALTGALGWEILSTRGTVGQARALRVVYEIVPQYYDYFGGRTLSNPHDILPYQKVTLPFVVSDTYLTNEPGVQGSDPTVFFGEVYANWGITVSLITMFLFGVVVQLLNHFLAGRIDGGGSAFDVAFFYLVYLWLADFALSFTTLYFDERFYFFTGLYLLRRWLVRPPAPQPLPGLPPS